MSRRVLCVWIVVDLLLGAWAVSVMGEPSPPLPTGRLALSSPAFATAGEEVPVGIHGASPELTSILVVLSNSAGTVTVETDLAAGRGTLRVPTEIAGVAGLLHIWAIAGADEASASVRIDPGDTVMHIEPLVGPKSIVADGIDRSMIVSLPTDAFGNVSAHRSDTLVRSVTPTGEIEQHETTVIGLVTWAHVVSAVAAGRRTVTTSLSGTAGPVRDLDEVPGPAGPVELVRDDARPLLADGRSLVPISSGPVVDRNGNRLLDGSVVPVGIDGPAGRGRVLAVVQGGSIRFTVEAPAVPGPVLVAAERGADPLRLDFAPAVDAVPVRRVSLEEGTALLIGPVRRVDGGLVPDGTQVFVDGRAVSTIDGEALVPEPAVVRRSVLIEVLGFRLRVER